MVTDRVALGDRLFQPLGEDVDRVFGSAADWVGDGKSLSDRVWLAGKMDRRAIDRIVREGLETGADPLKVARDLEDYLLPSGRPVRNDRGRLVKWKKDETGKLLRDARGRLIPANAKGVLTRTPRSGMGSYAARRLARTEVSRAFNQGVVQAAALNPFVEGVKWNLSGSHPDDDICDEHAQNHSAGMGPGEYRVDEFPQMPAHPHCFPAGTLVSGPPIIGSTQRWFDGELVEIITTDGHLLACTPNHPILTSQGWIAAGQLNEGSDVVCSARVERVGSLVDPNNNHRPALIEDVAVTLGGSLLVATMRVPTTAEDFHGDGLGSEISVIRTNGLLGGGVDAAIGKPSCEKQLSGGDKETSFLSRLGVTTLLLKGIWSTTNSGMRGTHTAGHLVGRSSGDHESLRLRAGTKLNATSNERLANRRASDSKGFGDSLDGLSGEIAPTNLFDGQRISSAWASVAWSPVRINKVRRSHFSGHVYNLQTTNGWYIANGIIVHNCLCFATQMMTQDADAVVDQLRRDVVASNNVVPFVRPQRSAPWQKLVALLKAAKALVTREAA